MSKISLPNSVPTLDLNKINMAKRSLFRLMEFKKMQSPNILIEQEKKILSQRLLHLNQEEINYLSKTWQPYYNNQVVQQEINNHQDEQAFKQYLLQLN